MSRNLQWDALEILARRFIREGQNYCPKKETDQLCVVYKEYDPTLAFVPHSLYRRVFYHQPSRPKVCLHCITRDAWNRAVENKKRRDRRRAQ